jgi:SWI/SNF-related matrix-associated actin-dependent regulator of chromatin subfamily A member 5
VQVIEKAYKKLRLDALVIQQGRLTQNANKVGKDDLLSMVKYGAELVFSSEPAKITDEDIDAIISKGESDTVQSLCSTEAFSEVHAWRVVFAVCRPCCMMCIHGLPQPFISFPTLD